MWFAPPGRQGLKSQRTGTDIFLFMESVQKRSFNMKKMLLLTMVIELPACKGRQGLATKAGVSG
jgi:hypothetical protein